MTPLHKLTRLAQIERRLAAEATGPRDTLGLRNERAEILASVGRPPLELANSASVSAWAEAFVETFPGVAVDEAFPWFEQIMSAAHDLGRAQGQQEGRDRASAEHLALLSVVRTMQGLLAEGKIVSQRLTINGATFSLSEYLAKAVRS